MALRKKKNFSEEFITETVNGEPYQFIPLGTYVVASPGVCGGRPTLKYTRMDARWVMAYLQNGRTLKELSVAHNVPVAAIKEVQELAKVYDYEKSYV